jgi:hypothetical protein
VSGYQVVISANVTVPSIDTKQGFAICPAGKQVLGGGFFQQFADAKVFVISSFAITSGGSAYTGWSAYLGNSSTRSTDFKVLRCLRERDAPGPISRFRRGRDR